MKHQAPARIDDNDVRLFREAIGNVRRIKPRIVPLPLPRPLPRPRLSEETKAHITFNEQLVHFEPAALEAGRKLEYLRGPTHLLRRLKQGRFRIEDSIDLHHMNVAMAKVSIIEFLAEAHQNNLRCVCIIHGKGLRSKNGNPVLKNLTFNLLSHHGDVIAFVPTPISQGGAGAVMVLLKTG